MRPEAATLRLALFPRASLLSDVLLVSLGAVLISASAQVSIPLPFTPVPITGQTFSVLLVGASLGTVRGGASGLLYVALGVAGAPVYADAAHGWTVITGASGGYLIGFPIAAALTGWLAERRWDRRFSSAIGAMLTGNVVIYLFGLPWLAVVLDADLDKTLDSASIRSFRGRPEAVLGGGPAARRVASRTPLRASVGEAGDRACVLDLFSGHGSPRRRRAERRTGKASAPTS